jgi:hypothetical protein
MLAVTRGVRMPVLRLLVQAFIQPAVFVFPMARPGVNRLAGDKSAARGQIAYVWIFCLDI